jgi:survival-of-motor-neuron-related-splicing factor 30
MGSEEDLRAQLQEYEEQLEGLEALLQEDPENEELLGLKSSTLELIAELSSLSSTASTAANSSSTASKPDSHLSLTHVKSEDSAPSAEIKEESRLSGQAEKAVSLGLYVGLPSEAVWPDDGLWYPATIEAIGDNGVRVKFKSYGDVLTLEASKVRASSLLIDKKRKTPTGGSEERGEEEHGETGYPEHMRIQDTDNEKTILHKQRLQKAWKAEKRKERQEVNENKAKVSWQNFNKNLKKTGFGGKKESMFRTSAGNAGKVGVVGSGKAMTKQTHAPSAPRHTPSPTLPSATYDPLAAPSYYIPNAPSAPSHSYPPHR